MNNKGFTLMELLTVVILLSILVILVLPRITNSVNNYSDKTDELVFTMIKESGKLYIDDNPSEFIKTNGNTYCITISKLVDKDYLKDPVEYNGEDITDTKSLKVTYNNGFDYELIDSSLCIE